MKLYMHAGACSLAPHIVCRELGLPVALVAVDRKTHKTPDGQDYLQINGNGYVPALQLDDGQVMIEGPAILQYLGGLKPEENLVPAAGTAERLALQSLLNFITAELHKPMAMMFYPDYAPVREVLKGHVAKRLDWIAPRLAGPFLTGETFTVADSYLFVCLNWLPFLGMDLTRWPALSAFMGEVGKRPKVREALAAEGLVPWRDEGIFFAPEAIAGKQREAARP
jgi:glutathione S-transferase